MKVWNEAWDEGSTKRKGISERLRWYEIKTDVFK